MSRPVDEYFHPPGEDPLWNESHYFDFVGDRLQGHARLGFYPNVPCASLWIYLHSDSGEFGFHDEALPPGRTHGTTVRGSGWWFDYRPGETTSRWTCRWKGPLARRGARGGTEGDRVQAELRLALNGRTDPFFYSEGAGLEGGGGDARSEEADRYEQPIHVEGRVDLNGDRHRVDAPGERDHSWGPRDWFAMDWCWCSGHFEDGSAFNLTRLLGVPYRNGFWFDGSRVEPLTDVSLRSDSAFEPGTARAWSRGEITPDVQLELNWSGGGTVLEVAPFTTTAIRWRRSDRGTPIMVSDAAEAELLLNRSACRMDRQGVPGRGYLEYGQRVEQVAGED